MRRRLGFVLSACILGAPVCWLAASSMLLLWVLGFWTAYPWPNKLWMWALYALEAPSDAIVHRWLVITGIVAALPIVLIGFGLVRRRVTKPEVYGKTEWARRTQMEAGSIATRREPF